MPLDLLRKLAELRDLLDPVLLARHALAQLLQLVPSLYTLVDSTTDPAGGGPFTGLATVSSMGGVVQVVANLALTAIVAFGFYRMMWSHSSYSQYRLRIMLPRILLGIVLINWWRPLFQAAVDLDNALCSAVATAGYQLNWHDIVARVVDAAPTTSGLPLVVLAAVGLGYAVLAIAYCVRFAVLVVLAITAPLAAVLFILHDTQGYARHWATLFASTLLMQPLQLLILDVGLSLEMTTRGILPNAFALATLILVFKVPGALEAGSAAGRHAYSGFKRHATRLAHVVAKA